MQVGRCGTSATAEDVPGTAGALHSIATAVLGEVVRQSMSLWDCTVYRPQEIYMYACKHEVLKMHSN